LVTGLLAGLYEFPTSDNVSKSIKPAAQEKLGRDILAHLVQCTSEQTVSKIIPIGDVVHVFSHIRKTYRVQWVIVKGDLAPPQVITHEMPHDLEQQLGKKSTKGNRKAPTQSSQNGLWIPLNEVAETK
jgi:A/G-specific adenine glycosylase